MDKSVTPKEHNLKDLKRLMNFQVGSLLNQAKLNQNQLPIYKCDPEVYPDYIALNTQPSLFHHTSSTAVAFYTYDNTFDGQNGLFSSVYYNNEKQLDAFKTRYARVRFVIAPDYSIFDDIWEYENLYRLFKTRILMLWFGLVVGAVVIPNAIYVSPDKMPLYYSGLEKCSVICFSTKGHIRRAESRNRVKEAVKYVTDHMALKTILVYSVCGDDQKSLRLFKYAQEHGVDILIVNNILRERNQQLMYRRHNNDRRK